MDTRPLSEYSKEEMASLLKRDVGLWNKKRTEEPGLQPDLANAELGQAILAEVDLTGADLANATLVDANLIGAMLGGADLGGAILVRANLTDASLRGSALNRAILFQANLSRADLTGTFLAMTNLIGASLTQADLQNAILFETIFGDTNLKTAKNLGECQILSPCSVDFRTLAKSWPLPKKFLRGCGLSDHYIDSLPSLIVAPLESYSVFISYSSQDEAFAQRLYADLQDNGVRCWYAPEDMKSGQKIHEQIDRAIQAHDRLLLVLSEKSMASEWVKTEIANARQKERENKCRVLFPISLVAFNKLRAWKCFDADSGKDSAREIREYFIPDFSNWKDDHDAYQKALKRLLSDLKPEKDSR